MEETFPDFYRDPVVILPAGKRNGISLSEVCFFDEFNERKGEEVTERSPLPSYTTWDGTTNSSGLPVVHLLRLPTTDPVGYEGDVILLTMLSGLRECGPDIEEDAHSDEWWKRWKARGYKDQYLTNMVVTNICAAKTTEPQVNTVFQREVDSTNLSKNSVMEFIIFGFPGLQNASTVLFCVFLFIYLSTVTGNGIIFLLIVLDKKLHTPMYFFVGNLSFLDMSSTTVTVPKMLSKFSMHKDAISFVGCFVQMYFFVFCQAVECLLLTTMAYDRYVAICFPLHYHTIMVKQLYVFLAIMSWILGLACPVAMIILALRLPFCGSNIIHHYYCDHPPILQLACADTSLNVTVGSSLSAFILVLCFSLIVISYVLIIRSVLKIASSKGRKKAFSTCASHFAAVNIYFLPIMFMYVRPTASYSPDIDSLVAMFYTVLTPMLNPVVYSLRNKDIKAAFRKQICCA
ncbi:olfactory receptor 6N1-like [Mantella aurantiaca]